MGSKKIIQLSESDLGNMQMFCGHSPTYKRGYIAKMEWLRERLREGMRYTLLQVDRHNAGMVETLPAEASWRGVEAPGYLFIHCFWVVGRNRGHGYGRELLETCLQDAQGTQGVAVVVSKAHWLPTSKLFLKNGFQQVDHSAPCFDLLVKQLNPQAPLPRFSHPDRMIPSGLTLYHSDQCPYTQNVAAIVEQVGRDMKIQVNLKHMQSAREAQENPCPYGTLAYYYNGELLTYHPTGTTELKEILRLKMAG